MRGSTNPTAPPHGPRRPARTIGNTPDQQRQHDTPTPAARRDGAPCASAADGERFGRSTGPPCPTLPYRGTAPVNQNQNQNPPRPGTHLFSVPGGRWHIPLAPLAHNHLFVAANNSIHPTESPLSRLARSLSAH